MTSQATAEAPAQPKPIRVRRNYRFDSVLGETLRKCSVKSGRTETAIIERALTRYLASREAWR